MNSLNPVAARPPAMRHYTHLLWGVGCPQQWAPGKRGALSLLPRRPDTNARTWSNALSRCSFVGAIQPGSISCRCHRNRAMMRVRSATRSSRWSTSTRISRSTPSRRAIDKFGSRSAARATARALIGSVCRSYAPSHGHGPSISVGPPPIHPQRSSHARAGGSNAGNPQSPTTAPRHSRQPTSTAQDDPA